MLFQLKDDPHQTKNLAASAPQALQQGQAYLAQWLEENRPYARGRDPHENVMLEGGPFHIRNQLPEYLIRLRSTGRQSLAAALEEKWAPVDAF